MSWYIPYVFLFNLITPSNEAFNYLPSGRGDTYIIQYSEFALSYNNSHRQANWVAYELTADELSISFGRRNYFSEDMTGGLEPASLTDYRYSGYDRGHLCRAEYCKSSEDAYRESFLLSNMSPQIGAGFNRTGGSWYNLEELEKKLARKYGKVYAVSGPVFRDNLGTIGANKVTIPGYFYKAFLLPDYKAAIGFILRHEITEGDPLSFSVTIDSLESFAHLDFYPSLADKIEDEIEARIDLEYWGVHTDRVRKGDKTAKSLRKKQAVQCHGIAKTTGVRCTRKTKNQNGYCWQHAE